QLGLAAAVLLALAHVITNLLAGCTCICSKEYNKSSGNKQLAAICLVLTWVILAVGFSLLIIGTLANSKSKGSCGITHHKFLSIGGILCFVHGVVCVSHYVSASATG
ncbi:hypothetical protein GIB67_024500, partial [Kingdonia uniflora]